MIDLATPDGINPAVLAEHGYRVAGLEAPVTTPAGNVVIDVILANGNTGHILAIESKCGGNIEEPQCARYAVLDAATVIRQARIDLFQRVTPSLDVVYACLGDHVGRVRLGLSTAGVTFPILAVYDQKITLETDIPSERLQRIFTTPVQLVAPPSRLIPFDMDSDVSVVEPHVLGALVAALTRSIPEITLAALTEQSVRHFALFGRRAQTALKQKVGEAARHIADDNPQTFRFHGPPPNRDGWVSLLKTPESNDPRGRTQAYQALARSSQSRRRRRGSVIIPGQTDLLDELDKADEGTDDSKNEQPEGTP
ncbi:hypothetical protein [Planomonospora sp. ID82291]|uniref:hypothetical protein n=1 Tax=Planomonospora sp. ID82291 TaxID=2738136 RepID=UPI001A1C87B7|nr:hypothetical protein [Planomonospora sp. ID82291]MBG0813240.1 hypothetical protein [Planomonospora sp. ID82291]